LQARPPTRQLHAEREESFGFSCAEEIGAPRLGVGTGSKSAGSRRGRSAAVLVGATRREGKVTKPRVPMFGARGKGAGPGQREPFDVDRVAGE